ncbi:RagB/SusD family nutrient uptake outer membrane protein [soil metagenome]
MKIYNKISIVITVVALLSVSSCKKILEEHPQSSTIPSFLGTPGGLLGGIAGVYDDIRHNYGGEGFELSLYTGTDENFAGVSAQAGARFSTYNGLSSADFNGAWNTWYQDINTLNGILQFGQTATLDAATKNLYLGQAKFLRAFCYYHLVTVFGEVPLHTTFITVATTSETRAPIADIYKLIIQDLTDASAQLPAQVTAPFLGKPATGGAAKLLLAEAYLARGWSSASQANDFAQAASIAADLITNKGTYGLDLWQDYGDAFKMANDYGKEAVLVADHSSNTTYGLFVAGSSGGDGTNVLPNLFRWNYVTLTSTAAGTPLNLNPGGGKSMMFRDVANGRPYSRSEPTPYVFNQAFAERVVDTRYNKTFQTAWIANTNPSGGQNTVVGSNSVTTPRGTLICGVDTAIWMPGYEPTQAQRDKFKGVIVAPSQYSSVVFPTTKKFDDLTRGGANDPSTRPRSIIRFAEAYFVAAEAYFKAGDNINAAKYLNYIRERAAYSPSKGAQNAIDAAAMDITPGQVTIDLLLDEYTREFFNEPRRWLDLVRTKQLLRRVGMYNPEANKNIKDFHVLRPVPQDEINAVLTGPKLPQNPGY